MSVSNPRSSGSCRAFTLVELLMVIAIMGLLASLLLPAVQGARRRAFEAQTTTLIRGIGLAVEQYERDRGALPSLSPGQYMTDEDQQRVLFFHLNGDPSDGWGSSHVYFHFPEDMVVGGYRLEPGRGGQPEEQGTPPGALLDGWGRGLRYQEYRSLPRDGSIPPQARRMGYSLFSPGADGVPGTDDDLGRLPP